MHDVPAPLWRLLLLLALSLALPVRAQQPDTLEGVLPELRIEATRASETEASAPFAVSVLTREDLSVALEPGLTLDAVLAPLPGVWISDRSHFALGEQIAVRGAGARSAFGVRGVQVVLDGIPLTLPDGQSVADVVDPAVVRRAEVIRGPASLYWGNGSGGVLVFSTDAPADVVTGRARVVGGSYGTQHLAAEAAAPAGAHRFRAFVSDVRQDGYRSYSEGRFTRGTLHGRLALASRTQLQLTAAFADQDAQHPGSLTAEQVEEDPQQANVRFAETNAGKTSTQVQAGATLLHQASSGLLTATAYGLVRDLDNPLPFAYIGLDRAAGGTRLAFQREGDRLSWGLSVDAAVQQDDRLNWNNEGGQPGDDRQLDQQETVSSLAGSAFVSGRLAGALHATAGLRFDRIRFSADDRLLTDGDASGHRTFSAWSRAAGLSYQLGPALLFANYTTAFETPTTTELVNRPDGAGGFNPELEPQRTRGFEIGSRGEWPAARLRYDVALFRLYGVDQLVPFQTPDGGDRTFYRNAGSTMQTGVEVAATWQAQPGLTLQATYTGSRFVFTDDALDGNRLPGVPAHRLWTGLNATRGRLWTRLSLEGVSDYYVDDLNEAQNEGYVVVDVNVGLRQLLAGDLLLQPFVQVGNVFDVRYNGSISVNAAGGRYYEPAPGRTVKAGLNVAF